MNALVINSAGVPSVHANLRFLLLNLSIASIYLLLAKSGMLFANHQGMIIMWRPSGGFALATLLLAGNRFAPGIFLGAFVTGISFGNTLFIATAIALGNTFEIVCGCWLLTRWLNFGFCFYYV